MTLCEKCDGGGLIGSGPNPHMREGAVKTCDVCKGTGKLPEAPVDNSGEEAPKEGGILKRIFG